MLHKFEGVDLGVIETCNSTRAVELSHEGWRLVAILEADDVTPMLEEVAPKPPDPDGAPNYVASPPNLTYERHFPVTQVTYLMAQPRDEQIKQLVKELQTTQVDATSAWEKVNELEADKAKLAEEVKRLAALETGHNDQIEALEKVVTVADDKAAEAIKDRKAHVVVGNKAAKRYRDHMTILWNELGAAKMRELLGPDVESPIPVPKPKTAMERIADGEGPVE